jgi:hypothetical protein
MNYLGKYIEYWYDGNADRFYKMLAKQLAKNINLDDWYNDFHIPTEYNDNIIYMLWNKKNNNFEDDSIGWSKEECLNDIDPNNKLNKNVIVVKCEIDFFRLEDQVFHLLEG